eukprot:TRINITY_DN5020_c0_g1_i1.p1 TRINITY_DN5020_c0_g1~~TRINITY_DN5020_c0_g1_i1.p1  ORF type:complete len:371 (+),score=32.77 TRINITY_DN5020_c0_g1_i1:128-1240(+)
MVNMRRIRRVKLWCLLFMQFLERQQKKKKKKTLAKLKFLEFYFCQLLLQTTSLIIAFKRSLKKMSPSTFIFLAIIVTIVSAQDSSVTVLATAYIPDATFATAYGTGIGSNVNGTATAYVNETVASASVVVVASSRSSKPHPMPTPTPTPRPSYSPHPTTPKKYHPVPVPTEPQPVCGDLYDASCTHINDFENCGFCVKSKYPLYGYGCTYTKEVVKVGGSKKKGPEYQVQIVPDCECYGTFILKGKMCPSCESALQELLMCANVEPGYETAIPYACFEKVGVTVEFLENCGYIKKASPPPPPSPKYYETKHKPAPHPTPSPVPHPYPSPSPHPAPVPVVATADSSAVAVSTGGGSASASSNSQAIATNSP